MDVLLSDIKLPWLYVYAVNELSLVANILVEKLTSVAFTFLSYKKK